MWLFVCFYRRIALSSLRLHSFLVYVYFLSLLFVLWCHCLLIISCFIKIQNSSAFLVLALLVCFGKRPFNACSSSSCKVTVIILTAEVPDPVYAVVNKCVWLLVSMTDLAFVAHMFRIWFAYELIFLTYWWMNVSSGTGLPGLSQTNSTEP